MQDLIIGKSIAGKAVFARRNFKKGERIIDFKGKLIKRDDLPKIVKPEDDRYIQIGKDKFMGASGDYDDYFNHSCNPNSGVKIKGDN